ncbi:MBL fold metallo-hydrolase [Neglectibacter caecimuris]|uniref:MBL fold metallo-hydrolase n=1 Tax=Neglectibacter caecimuris TaxID=3093658 RepID=UPI002AC9C51E|nr:MBL fold metallo-hydrolase [Neglectibacter sp. M00184]
MHTSRFFKASKIFDNVTLISGLGGEQCYLVEGEKKALLIDGLSGVGSLKSFVRELTDLPVQIVNTHGHVDHCGANFEYGECLIHPADIRLMYDHSDPLMRLNFARSGAMFRPLPVEPTLEDVIPPRAVKTFPVFDGNSLDLGGVTLEVIGVPGHSFGTIVLLDSARRVVYSGDACNANTLLFLEGSASIEEYRESLLHFKSFQPEFDGMYGGHGPGPVPNTIIDEAIELCEEILKGTDDQIEGASIGKPCLYAKAKDDHFRRLDGKLANIAYSRENIRKKERRTE